MVTIVNYSSGEILLKNEAIEQKMPREASNRLVMAARMHNVAEFLEKIPSLIDEPNLLASIVHSFEGKDASGRWAIKEKFARLRTLSKSYEPSENVTVVETVTL